MFRLRQAMFDLLLDSINVSMSLRLGACFGHG